jgi:hypothetical protein
MAEAWDALPVVPGGLTESGKPGDTRYSCPFWPCEWFVDQGDNAAAVVENDLRIHLDAYHPGWTLAEVRKATELWDKALTDRQKP